MKNSLQIKIIGGVLIFSLAALVTLVIGYNIYVTSDFDPGSNVSESSSSSLGVCTMDARACPDGSFVGRNAANNCEFDPCPAANTNSTIQNSCCNQSDWYNCSTPEELEQGVVACGLGECAACGANASTSAGSVEGSGGLGAVVCTQEVAICADGTTVSRNSNNNCQFDSCADGSTPQVAFN